MPNNVQKIPKKIHYCWFGGKDKPSIVVKCIESWKKHLHDYEFIEWNENNTNFYENKYMKQAYEAKKFAFVSDYVRVRVLYEHGGIYLDTDVELFKSFDNLLHHESFWGFEQENFIATSTMGAAPKNKLIKEFLNLYRNKNFLNKDGSFNEWTNVAMVTSMLEDLGLIKNGEYQELEGIGVFYPQTYFSPFDYINCRKLITRDTYAIHHFHKSWLPFSVRVKGSLKTITAYIIGGDNIAKLRKLGTRV